MTKNQRPEAALALTMEKMQILLLNEKLAKAIRSHGSQMYPHECCGALLGQDTQAGREIRELFPLVNRRTDSPRNRFSVTPEDVLDAERAARAAGLDIVGWYHSHPDHPAIPSEFDREHAWPWYSYVIVSVAKGEAQTVASWRLADDRMRFEPEKIAAGAAASATP
jgi:proteasome lid subunit RPN8/RPN11